MLVGIIPHAFYLYAHILNMHYISLHAISSSETQMYHQSRNLEASCRNVAGRRQRQPLQGWDEQEHTEPMGTATSYPLGTLPCTWWQLGDEPLCQTCDAPSHAAQTMQRWDPAGYLPPCRLRSCRWCQLSPGQPPPLQEQHSFIPGHVPPVPAPKPSPQTRCQLPSLAHTASKHSPLQRASETQLCGFADG